MQKICGADGCDLIDMDDYRTYKAPFKNFTRIHELSFSLHNDSLLEFFKKEGKKRIDQETQKHINRIMEAKRIISARYADNDIDIENISSDFSELLGVDGSVKNVSSKNDSLIGLIFAPKQFPNMVGQYSLHIESDKIAFLSFKSSSSYKLATNELIRFELKIQEYFAFSFKLKI